MRPLLSTSHSTAATMCGSTLGTKPLVEGKVTLSHKDAYVDGNVQDGKRHGEGKVRTPLFIPILKNQFLGILWLRALAEDVFDHIIK